ncbi:hypothetical protein [Xylanibacter rodentium]|uniref:DUF4412 domain-containing protein n=3 Tax=Bacteroidales TaxID=171549 RepID=A0ABX2ATC8_9BACT|nr:hypothetical protein [Xylanibacter rodentium]NPE11522.1 hypothetical protein [Prevotella sp. PJ1A]NPE13386.1 hypothetical protein [Xylanibacter rodentium]NPE38715.1 hypothetical protein [Prevotella sp. PCJ2]
MKRTLMFLLSAAAGLSAYSQDVIVTKEGDAMKVYGVEISGTSVFFREQEAEDSPIRKMKKEDLLMVKYRDGKKVIMDDSEKAADEAPASAVQTQPEGNVQVTVENLSAEGQAANNAILERLNAPVELVLKDKDKSDIGKKEAARALAVFGVKKSSVMANDEIEISYEMGRLTKRNKNAPAVWDCIKTQYTNSNPAIKFSVKNKTNRILYVDLGTTFFIRLEEPICFYTPSSTTTSHGKSGGAGVNLGAVTGALGIGGMAGSLANGVNVGGGTTSSTTSTTYSQRIVAIPPMSSIELAPQYLFGNEEKTICDGAEYRHWDAYSYILIPRFNFSKEKGGVMLVGDHYKYSEESSPIQMSFMLSYGTEENCASTKTLASHYFLKDLLGRKTLKGNLLGNNTLKGDLNTDTVPFTDVWIEDKGSKAVFPKQ